MDRSKGNDACTMAHSIEQIYSSQNKLLVLPASFCQNLLTYSLSGSKLLVNVNGSTTAAGLYQLLTNWRAEQAKNEIQFPTGVIRCMFDNEQVVRLHYDVRAGSSSVPVSVITSHGYMVIDPESDLQMRKDLKPPHWLFGPLD